MSLLQKRREQEKLRQNGLNDPVFPVSSSHLNGWPAGSVPLQHSFPAYTPLTAQRQSKNVHQGQQTMDYMKSLLQQADLHAKVRKGSKKMEQIPSWSVPATSPPELNNVEEPIIVDNNLQAGCYYEDSPVYFDPATGKTLNVSQLESTAADTANDLNPTPAPIDPSTTNTMQQGQCINPNCVTCKPSSVQAK